MVLAPDGSRVIVGGSFTTLSGTVGVRHGFGQHASTGAILPWAANQTIRDAGSEGAITSLTHRRHADLRHRLLLRHPDGQLRGNRSPRTRRPATSLCSTTATATPTTSPDRPGHVQRGPRARLLAVGELPGHQPAGPLAACAGVDHRTPTGTNTGPDTYGWNYDGLPDSTILHWFPTSPTGTLHRAGPGRLGAGRQQPATSRIGGEFPNVNGTAQQGLTRFAGRRPAPNKRGPATPRTRPCRFRRPPRSRSPRARPG